ncbi:hypothetical protein WN943_012924 [Citrus x changshan-huyou]
MATALLSVLFLFPNTFIVNIGDQMQDLIDRHHPAVYSNFGTGSLQLNSAWTCSKLQLPDLVLSLYM